MSNNSPGRKTLRLVVCGVCFLPECPWSRWIEGDDEGGLSDSLHEISVMALEKFHEEFGIVDPEITPEERQTKLDEIAKEYFEITGDEIIVEVRMEDLLEKSSSQPTSDESTLIKTDDDGFLQSLLNAEEQQKQRDQDRYKH
jgi:hypothetical protein